MDAATQYAMQGQQYLQAGMYEQAVQAFYQAIQLAPLVDGLYYNYASACLWRGLLNDALESRVAIPDAWIAASLFPNHESPTTVSRARPDNLQRARSAAFPSKRWVFARLGRPHPNSLPRIS